MPSSICNTKNIIYEIAKFPSAYGVKARWNESINGWLTDKNGCSFQMQLSTMH
jgi:predicted 3-demethylubiquinone-9 3-methyltransferase (glyoxalase superfamily)